MKAIRGICFFALLLLPAPLLAAGPAVAEKPREKAKPVTVPFELLKTGHMAVMVKVNGKGPYRLIFDTGAPITLISNKVAKEAGLLKGMARPAFSLFGTMGEAKIKTLEVGGQKAENVDAIVMDHPTVGAMAQALGPIEGIVGFPFFARFKMTLDYQAKTMTFTPNGYKPSNVMDALMRSILAGSSGRVDVLDPPTQWGLTAEKGAGDEEAGVTIKEVLPGSPAAKGGLEAGDRLLTLDGRWTDTVEDLFKAAEYVKPGKTVPLKVKRDGKELTLKVTPIAGL
jgi:hypothetical protein